MRWRGWVDVTQVPVDGATGLVDPDDVRRAIRSDTRLVALTHVSNVTGTVQPVHEIGRIAREAGVPFVVDAAQSAGHVSIDVQADCIDLLAAPGHKALLGPTGTGFLYLRPGMEKLVRTVREGGTGSVSEQPVQPQFLPDKYEPGSHNAAGIIGLSAGVKWVSGRTVEQLAAHDLDLARTFIDGISDVEGLTCYGPQGVKHRIGVFAVRLDGFDPHELSAVLEANYGILTRSGIHCAPLAHQALGTADCGGATRFSFGPFLSKQDVKYATDALAEIAASRASVV
jgi:selenocysteine lyase/cysteine desulfurase